MGSRGRDREESRWKRSPQGVAITYNRVVEAARKARSKRPARAERTEVMTIIQPLRRPGHVSMELGFFAVHTGSIQRLLTHPKASPYKLNALQGLAVPWPRGPRPPESIYLVHVPQPRSAIAPTSSTLDSPSRSFPPVPYHRPRYTRQNSGFTLSPPCSLQPGIEGLQVTSLCHPTRLPW